MWHPAIFALFVSLVCAEYTDTELAWAKNTPGIPRYTGEYCQPVFFHTMIKGYARRVSNPADADLFYVPIYSARLECHPDARRWETLLRRITALVGTWIARFPAKDGLGPNFFTASGQVCSCKEPRRQHECNPVASNQDLDDKVVTLAWESPVPGLQTSLPNVVVPYITTLHDILPWQVHERRRLLVTMSAGVRPTKCTYCGPCGRPPPQGHEYFFDANHTCACGCTNMRRELREMFAQANSPDIQLFKSKTSDWVVSLQNRYRLKLSATFCIEPIGDCLTRKSFYESIMLGCIPVVFREDSLYLDQLPSSHAIPYRRLWVAVPNGTTDIFAMLRAISNDDIIRRRRVIKRYGRRLVFSSNNSQHGGYNDFGRPDAFASALKEVWDRSKQTKNRSHLVSPAKCEHPFCAAATCEQRKKDKYTDAGANANLSASDYPKVYVLPLSRKLNSDLLRCVLPWHARIGEVEYFARTNPALPFGPVEDHFRNV